MVCVYFIYFYFWKVSPQLVAFCPDRSFFSASKGGHHVSMWSKREDGSHVEATEKPNCTLKVAEDDDQIFRYYGNNYVCHNVMNTFAA